MIKKSIIVLTNILTILLCPILGGLIILFIILKHGIDEEFLKGEEWLIKHLMEDI